MLGIHALHHGQIDSETLLGLGRGVHVVRPRKRELPLRRGQQTLCRHVIGLVSEHLLETRLRMLEAA